MDLSYKERLFVAYYLGVSSGNATDAAARAGYGSNRHSSHTLGGRLLRKVAVQAAIDAKLASTAMAADEVLARLTDIGSASLGDFLDVDRNGHRVNLLKGKRRGKLHTLKKIKTKVRHYQRNGEDETEIETEIEVKDALPALVKLGEYHGLFKQRTEVELKDGGVPYEVGDDGRDAGVPLPTEATPVPEDAG